MGGVRKKLIICLLSSDSLRDIIFGSLFLISNQNGCPGEVTYSRFSAVCSRPSCWFGRNGIRISRKGVFFCTWPAGSGSYLIAEIIWLTYENILASRSSVSRCIGYFLCFAVCFFFNRLHSFNSPARYEKSVAQLYF